MSDQHLVSMGSAALQYATDGVGGALVAPLPLCRPVVGRSRGCMDHGPDCVKPGKRALVKWKQYQEQAPILQDVGQWWAQWPEANLGLVTGASSRVVVVDVDGPHGMAALEQHGALPATLSALSGRPGGRHFYFKHPGSPVASRAGVLPGVDVRADGGLVVLPPSRHYSGACYRWDESSVGHGLAALPAWLLALLRGPETARGERPPMDTAAVLNGVPQGQRDEELFRLACKLRAADVPQYWAEDLVLEAAANCRPPFPADEAKAKVVGAYGRYIPNAAAGLSSLSSALGGRESDESARPWLITLAELAERYGSAVDWLVEGYIPRAALTLIPGPPESFKSWAMADLCRAVRTGTRWMGQFEVPRGGVLYVEQERARNLVYQARLLTEGTDCDLSDLSVIPPAGVDLLAPLWQVRVTQAVQERKPHLVVINSFRAVYRGQAGDGPTIARALGWLGVLADDTGAAIVLLDQVNKAGGTGLVRGMAAHADSLQKEYEADAVLHIERDRDPVGRGTGPARVYVGKLREGDAGPPFAFDVATAEGAGVHLVYQGETTVERAAPLPQTARDKVRTAIRGAAGPQSALALANATGLSVGTVSNTLSAMKADGEAHQPAYGRWQLSSLSPTLRDDESDETPDEPSSGDPCAVCGQPLGPHEFVWCADCRDTARNGVGVAL